MGMMVNYAVARARMLSANEQFGGFGKYSTIGKHLLEVHGGKNLLNEDQFRVLKTCYEKFDCLVYEMLFIKELKSYWSVLNSFFSL